MSKTSNKLFKVKNSSLKVHHDAVNVSDEEILLLNAPKETDEVFRKLRIPSKAGFIQKELKEVNEIKAVEGLFEGCEAYKGKYIKELCNSHFLSVIPLENLYAYLPTSAAQVILDFTKKFEKAMLESEFYILAPREYFTEEYNGKEAETYIIFYRERLHSAGDNYNRIVSEDNLIQLHASGNDFPDSRKWLKYFDFNVYFSELNSFSKGAAHIVVGILLLVSIILMLCGTMTGSISFLIPAIIMLGLNNTSFNSNNFWNEKV